MASCKFLQHLHAGIFSLDFDHFTIHQSCGKVPFLGTDLRVSRVQMRSQPSTFTRGRVRIWEPSGLSRQQAGSTFGVWWIESLPLFQHISGCIT